MVGQMKSPSSPLLLVSHLGSFINRLYILSLSNDGVDLLAIDTGLGLSEFWKIKKDSVIKVLVLTNFVFYTLCIYATFLDLTIL